MIDVDNAIIVDVEATTAIRQAEILAAKRMIERAMECFDLYPARLIGDSAYGSAEMLNWLVHGDGIEPHVPVFDKSKRTDGTFSREDFTYDHASDTYRCPAGKTLQHYRRRFTTPRTGVPNDNLIRYRASTRDCGPCPLKPRCCPNAPARKVLRSIHEGARDLARDIAKTEAYQTLRRQRKKVEMLFAHLKRILKLDRLRLRGPCGARDEFHLAATVQNLRKLAKLIPGPQAIPATGAEQCRSHPRPTLIRRHIPESLPTSSSTQSPPRRRWIGGWRSGRATHFQRSSVQPDTCRVANRLGN